ncbi:MAG: hypothetical protein PF961_10390 [Planctomycetota bacterium]|nr:hypothetical protein [Planctomycetota bacterium]
MVAARSLVDSAAEVTLQCTATGPMGRSDDPFALNPSAPVPALRAAVGPVEAVVIDQLEAGKQRDIVLTGLITGRNEVVLHLAPTDSVVALRCVVMVNGQPRLNRVLWHAPGDAGVYGLDLNLGDDVEPDYGH